MKRIFTLLLSSIMVLGVDAQTTVTVGSGTLVSGTNDNSGPIYRSSSTSTFNFSRHTLKYTTSDLAAIPAGALITKIAWDKSTAFSNLRTATFSIWMRNTADNSLSTRTWGNTIAGATQVYANSSLTLPAVAGWTEFVLTNPFTHNGQALEISTDWAINSGTGNASTGAFQWRYAASTATQSIGTSDGTALTNATSLASAFSRLMNIQITYTLPPACTGTPNAGTTAASANNVCRGESFLLTNTGYSSNTLASGLSYNWQISTNAGSSWANISMATNPDSFRLAQTALSAQYRLSVTCTPSNQTTNSNAITVAANNTPVSYLTLGSGYFQDFESWNSNCAGSEVPDGNWRNLYQSSDSSWRRNDEGATANWTTPASGTYTPAAKSGTYSARFHSAFVNPGRRGALDAYFNCSAGSATKRVAFYYINASGTADSLRIMLSTDGGSNFNQIGTTLLTATNWSWNSIPFTSSSAQTIVRLEGFGAGTGGDIGIDSFVVETLNACAGTPSAGSITSAFSSACVGQSVRLYATGFSGSGLTGLSYQWQQNVNNAGFTNITGANTPDSLTILGNGSNTVYRLQVTCANGGGVGNATYSLLANNPIPVTLPASFDFEQAWEDGCGTRDIPSAAWRNQWLVGDSSWRQDNDTTVASWRSPGSYGYTPRGANGSARSARFHSGFTEAGRRGSLSLFVNASAGNPSKQISYYFINTSGSDSLFLGLSTDNGATFTNFDTVTLAAAWTLRTRNITTSSANTIIRFQARGDYGSTDIGLDEVNLIVNNSCSGAPSAGSTSSPTSISCNGALVKVYNTGFQSNVGVSGLSYQWQQSLNGGAFSSISGATTPDSVSVTYTGVSTQYRLQVTCNAGAPVNSNAVTITNNPVSPVTIPASFDFEQPWIDGCGLRDVPTNAWRNQFVTTDSSWRQDNDGAGVWTNNLYPYNPTGANGTLRSARFHAIHNNRGALSLYLNAASGPSGRQVSYSFINTGGTDSLKLYLSTDNGTTFTQIDSVGTASAWTRRTINFTSASANTILRFQARGTNGASDIGLDEVMVENQPLVDAAIVSAAPSGTQFYPTNSVVMRSVIRNNVSANTTSVIRSVKVIEGTNYRSVVTRPAGLSGNTNDTLNHAPFTGWVSGTNYIVRDTVYQSTDNNQTNDTLTTQLTPATILPTLVYWLDAPSRDSLINQLNDNGYAGTFNLTNTLPSTSLQNWKNIFFLASSATGWSANLRDSLTSFLNSGTAQNKKALLVFGNDIAYLNDPSRSALVAPADTVFLRQVLRTRYLEDDWNTVSPFGSANRTIKGVGSFTSVTGEVIAAGDPYPDLVRPVNGGNAAFIPVNGNSTDSAVAISYVGTTYNTFLGTNVYRYYTQRQFFAPMYNVTINSITLLVRLSSFTGERAGAANKLFFTTATEQANRGFVVERSADGRNYSNIGFVATQATDGNSNQPLSYQFSDDKPLTGLNYYRLRQQDRSGREELSQVVVLRTDDVKQLQLTMLYPNPARTQVGLMVEAPKAQSVQVIITDLQGRQVASRRMDVVQGNNQLTFNIASLAQGSYLLKLVCNDGCITPAKQFVKQ